MYSNVFLGHRYHDQLSSLETKIPSAEHQVAFKWKDAFDKGASLVYSIVVLKMTVVLCLFVGGLFVGRMALSKYRWDMYRSSVDGFPLLLTVLSAFIAQASLSFERICVLFNVGAMYSQIAANQNVEYDDGLKLATKYFQQAAGTFQYVKVRKVWRYGPYPPLPTSQANL